MRGTERQPCAAATTLPQLLPQPPTYSKGHADIGRPAALWRHAQDDDASSARQWELQMEAVAETVKRINTRIHGPSYVEPTSNAALQSEIVQLKLTNRELRAANRELKEQLSAEAEARKQDALRDALSDEESDAAHLRERRRMRDKLEQADAATKALRIEVGEKTREIAELRIRLGQLAPGPNNMLSQMRAVNLEHLRVHSARQARELERAQLELRATREALLGSPRLAGAPDATGDSEQLIQAVARLAESEEQRRQLIREKSELIAQLEKLRSGQFSGDALKKLNALRNRSAVQEAKVARARSALDESQRKPAQYATTTAGFRLDTELSKLKELQVQVQAAELLLHEKHQLTVLINMVARQAEVIERLQVQVEVSGCFRSRYLSVRDGESNQTRDDEVDVNMGGLDQLRLQVEMELVALSKMNAELSDAFSRMPTAQGKQLAGPCTCTSLTRRRTH